MREFISKNKIEISGIPAWCIFAYAAIKLGGLYVHIPLIRVIIYFSCSLLYLTYFSLYFRPHFDLKRYLLLSLSYSIGLTLLELIYGCIVYLEPFTIPNLGFVILGILNIFLGLPIFFLLRLLNRKE